MKALGRIIKQIVCVSSTQMDCIQITINTTFCCSFICQCVSKLKNILYVECGIFKTFIYIRYSIQSAILSKNNIKKTNSIKYKIIYIFTNIITFLADNIVNFTKNTFFWLINIPLYLIINIY